MLPLHDENPSGRTPWVTYALIGINVLVYLYEASLGGRHLQHFLADFAAVPRDLTHLSLQHPAQAMPTCFTVISSMFMHGGFTHLGGNMLYLYIFGDNVEDRLGHVPYLLFYLVAGIAATLSHVWSSPLSLIPLVGASGAIGGVLGCYAVLYPQARIMTFAGWTMLYIPAFYFLGFWFAMQALNGLGSLLPGHGMHGGTAWWAHIGGFVVGIGMGLYLKANRRQRWD